MRRHDVAAKLHHYCGLLVVMGVIAWLAVDLVAVLLTGRG